jgi:hypothetical protein
MNLQFVWQNVIPFILPNNFQIRRARIQFLPNKFQTRDGINSMEQKKPPTFAEGQPKITNIT